MTVVLTTAVEPQTISVVCLFSLQRYKHTEFEHAQCER
jgi:hypothetical protein